MNEKFRLDVIKSYQENIQNMKKKKLGYLNFKNKKKRKRMKKRNRGFRLEGSVKSGPTKPHEIIMPQQLCLKKRYPRLQITNNQSQYESTQDSDDFMILYKIIQKNHYQYAKVISTLNKELNSLKKQVLNLVESKQPASDFSLSLLTMPKFWGFILVISMLGVFFALILVEMFNSRSLKMFKSPKRSFELFLSKKIKSSDDRINSTKFSSTKCTKRWARGKKKISTSEEGNDDG